MITRRGRQLEQSVAVGVQHLECVQRFVQVRAIGGARRWVSQRVAEECDAPAADVAAHEAWPGLLARLATSLTIALCRARQRHPRGRPETPPGRVGIRPRRSAPCRAPAPWRVSAAGPGGRARLPTLRSRYPVAARCPSRLRADWGGHPNLACWR